MQNKFNGSVSNGYVLIALLVFAATCSILCATLLGSSQSRGPTNPSPRTLTFEDRVAYQRAIEDVYWRHRIWPQERSDPKPSLDTVMPQTELKKKVADYLQDLLDASRQRHITGLSPRAGLALLHASQAWALMHGREMLLPEDIQAVGMAVMAHRLGHDLEQSGQSGRTLADNLLHTVPVP